jgi:hypothetical protein
MVQDADKLFDSLLKANGATDSCSSFEMIRE